MKEMRNTMKNIRTADIGQYLNMRPPKYNTHYINMWHYQYGVFLILTKQTNHYCVSGAT